jgi:hypothetical protein
MSFRGIALLTARAIILPLALFAFAGSTLAQQSAPCKSRNDADYIRLSSPVVKAWSQVPVGTPVYALGDVTGAKGWLDRAMVQRVDAQTGIWNILMEPGYSVFEIYPYLAVASSQPCVYQGIVVKVNGILTVGDLLTAIRNRTATTKIDSYDVFGSNGLSVQRYSRRSTAARGKR